MLKMSGRRGRIVAKVTDFGLSGLANVMTGRAVANPGKSLQRLW